MSERDDEALVPDEVTGPGDATVPADGPPRRRDRKPLFAIVAGLTACWFTLFGPLLAIILAPIAVLLGRSVLNRIKRDGGTPTERKQARIGFVAGIIAVVLLVVQVALFQLFFEWEKDVPEVEPKGAESSASTTTTTAPPG